MTRIQKQAPPRGRLAAFVTAVQVGVGAMVLARFFAELAEFESADGLALVVGCAAMITTFAAQRCCGSKALNPRTDELGHAVQQSAEPAISIQLIARNLTINVSGGPVADSKFSLDSPSSVDTNSSVEESVTTSEGSTEAEGDEVLYRLADGAVSGGSSPLGLGFLGDASRSDMRERRLRRFEEGAREVQDDLLSELTP